VKDYAGAQVEDEGERVGLLPTESKAGGEVELGIADDEAVKYELVDVLGLGVDADAGVEAGGAGLDEEDDRSRRWTAAMAASEGEQSEERDGEPTHR
jgi:hypothetical protein